MLTSYELCWNPSLGTWDVILPKPTCYKDSRGPLSNEFSALTLTTDAALDFGPSC